MKFAIIEIGSNNTKTHVYDNNKIIYENNTTIEFKKNYSKENKLLESDLDMLYSLIVKAKEFTDNVRIYGCSIFRKLSSDEINDINKIINDRFNLKIEVVSQEDEAYYTALGVYNNISYDKCMCVFIGGGGSIELIFVKNKEIIDKKYYNFGVVDVTNEYSSLKDDIPSCTFKDVEKYINDKLSDITLTADVLILAGGDHLYWYNNARYNLLDNTLYEEENQKYMIDINLSDKYDYDMMKTSLDEIRNRSDNPLWFDGSRAMKVITNCVSHKVKASYIIPTKINMENGIKNKLMEEEK